MDADARLTDMMRSAGWPHVLDLIAAGLRADGERCESERWPETAEAAYRLADETEAWADEVRDEIAAGEAADREAGCE